MASAESPNRSFPHWTPARRRKLEELFATVPFPNLLEMRLRRLAAGEALIVLPALSKLRQYQGIIHGGALAAVADTAATFAAMTILPEHTDVVTVEFKLNFLQALEKGHATAHGKVVRAGRRITVAEVDLHGHTNKTLLLTGTFTMLNFSAATPPFPKGKGPRQ